MRLTQKGAKNRRQGRSQKIDQKKATKTKKEHRKNLTNYTKLREVKKLKIKLVRAKKLIRKQK